MSRRRKKQGKSFQQRQTERKQRERQDEQELDDIVDNLAMTYACSTETARDFASRCGDRLDDLDYDLDFVRIAVDFWAAAPAHAAPLTDALRELAAEHERHAAAITDLRHRMIALTNNEAIHHHLDQPPEYYQNQLRLRLFTAPAQPAVQHHEMSPDH